MNPKNLSGVQHHGAGRILLVDCDQDFARSLTETLVSWGYQVEVAGSAHSSLAIIAHFDAEVALIGNCPESAGEIDLFVRLKAIRPHILCVMMAVYEGIEKVITAIEKGAYDYVPKPLDWRYLSAVLRRCFEKLRLEQQRVSIEDALHTRDRELQEVNDRLKTIANSTRSLAACSDIEEINRRLLEEFARNMAAEGGSLYLVTEEALILGHTLDPGHALPSIPFPLRKGSVFENVLRRKEPILVKDIEQERGILPSGWRGYQNGAVLVFPLSGAIDDIQGLITLHNRTYPPFTSQDREIGTILASYSYELIRATHAMEELRASEERYRRIFENIQDVYYETLLDGTILEVSPSIAAFSRYTRQELLNSSVLELYAEPDDRVGFLEQIRQHGKVSDYEIRLRDKDGSVIPCALTARLLCDEHGAPRKICGSLRDISDRKRAEKTLREQKALLDEIFNSVQEGIGIVDEHEVILFCNPAYAEIFDQPPEQLIGKSLLTLFNHDASALILNQTGERQAGRISTYELPLVTEKGITKYIRVTVSPRFSADGSYAGAFGALLDITERRLAEQEVQQLNTELEARVQQRTAELERANQELRQFVYAASHDLKTPLHGISKMASWLLEDYAQVLDLDGQSQMLQIVNRVNRLDTLIDGMLEYSSIGRVPRKMEPIHLNVLVRNVIKTIMPPDQIQILIEDSLPVIMGNAVHLRQVFSHLLENAVAFMDKPARTVTIRAVDDGECWRFSIADNGRGIDKKYYEKIFEIFQTLQRRDEHESSGIGLALVKRIIEEIYGGTIWVESKIGTGSTFFFTLPKTHARSSTAGLKLVSS